MNDQYDFAATSLEWQADANQIHHLYELDPTHVAAQPSVTIGAAGRQTHPQASVMSSICLLAEEVHAAVLLEIDPTHLQVR